jgi:hypothetical protein
MKKALKKLHLNRETLVHLEAIRVTGGRAVELAAGTHYESICKDLCKEEEPAKGFA